MAILAADAPLSPLGISAPVRSIVGPTLRSATVIRVALLLLVVGNLGRVPIASVGPKDAPVLFNDLLVVAILAAGLFAGLRARSWRLDSVGALAIAFAAVGGASAVLAVPRFGLTGFELAFSLAYLARWLAYFGIYLVAINTLREADALSVWQALETAILVFAVFGIIQSLFLPGFAQLVYPESVRYVDWDPQGRRLVSTLLDPNFAGCLIEIGLLVLLATLAVGGAVPWWKPLVLFVALLLTLSRGSVLAFAVGGVVILLARGLSRRLVRLAAVVAALCLPFAPVLLDFARAFNKLKIDASALARVTMWLRGLAVFADHPVIGVGFNTYGFIQRAYGWLPGGKGTFGIEGGLLFVAVMTGLVGVALYVGMIAVVLRRCRGAWRDPERSTDDRGLAIGVAAATIAVVVHSLFVNSLVYPLIMEPLWILWALVFVTTPRRHSQTTPAPGPVVVSLPPALAGGAM